MRVVIDIIVRKLVFYQKLLIIHLVYLLGAG